MKEIADTPERMVSRKNDHIAICATQQVESSALELPMGAGSEAFGGVRSESFSGVRFVPEALPEANLKNILTKCSFLGSHFAFPILITGMTGGVEKGREINEALGLAAQKYQIPMGLGSQKMMVGRQEFQELFDVRKKVSGVFTIGNIGAVSFNYGIVLDDIKRLVDTLELSAFALHLNALQECVQPEGERNFSGLLNSIEKCVKGLRVPVMVKEVGSGMSGRTFLKLANCGVAAVDVGGKGGTSWSAIEGMRADAAGQRLGELFRNWGFSTEESVAQCLEVKKQHKLATEIVATGGIRNGLEVAKAVACGASMAGVGLPFFRRVTNPSPGQTAFESLCDELDFFIQSLNITMFCSGAQTLTELPSRVVSRVIQKDFSNDK